MSIGVVLDDFRLTSYDDFTTKVRAYAAAGFGSIWMGQHLNWDPLALFASLGREVPEVGFGTAIVPTYPRHPMTLASQALTVQVATSNRLQLGVGPSHRFLMEDHFGYSYDRPARHVREYLDALGPLLRGEDVAYQGHTLKATGNVGVPGASPPPLLVSALGPVMLRIAGELTDGTIAIWSTPQAIGGHVVPTITTAAEAAGRPRPRVVVMLAASVTADPDGSRSAVAESFQMASSLPAYRAVLDREGATGVEDTLVAGDEDTVARAIDDMYAAGATDIVTMPAGKPEDEERTLIVLGELARARPG